MRGIRKMGGCTWILPDGDQKQMNDEIKELQVFNAPTGVSLYHYTSRELFWKILEEESFLARHILFSNDEEENRIGKIKVAEAMKKARSKLAESDALPFMICFSAEEDLLSQWRGYAKEGIAMEFDFSKGLYGLEQKFSPYYCFTVMNEKKDLNSTEGTEKKYLSTGLRGEKGLFTGAILSPYEVIYTSNDDCGNKSLSPDGKGVDSVIQEKVQRIKKLAPAERVQQYAGSMIPYIKNEKFKEEKEYRLIFDMRQLVSGELHLLQDKYVYLDVDGVKKPNIRVKFGNQYLAEQGESVTIYYSDDRLTDKIKNLQSDLKKEKINMKLVRKPLKYRMEKDELLLSEGKNQKLVYTMLRQRLYGEKVKIWCDGHMPIRRIIVGPSRDAELMKCSIEEYIKTKYWMHDIAVEISKIPLRT